MSEINLGRVQGGSFFFSTAEPSNKIQKNSLTPNNITPLIGDCVVFNKGGLYKIIEIVNEEITLETVGSIAGPQGDPGPKGDYKIIAELSSESALPASPNNFSDAYLIGGNIYIWVGSGWKNMGPIAQTSVIYGDTVGTSYEGSAGKQLENKINATDKKSNEMIEQISGTWNNQYTLIQGGYIAYDDGTVNPSPDGYKTDYIPVNVAKGFYLTGVYLGGAGALIAYYDINKKYLKDISVQGTDQYRSINVDLTDPKYSKVAYIRCSSYGDESVNAKLTLFPLIEDTHIVYGETEGTAYEGNKGKALEGKLNEANNVSNSIIEQISGTWNNQYTLIQGGYIAYDDGTVNTTQNGYKTDYISVNVAKGFYLTGVYLGGAGALIAYYDINKKYLKDISVQGTDQYRSINVDLTDPKYSKVAYIRCSSYGDESVNAKLTLFPLINLQDSSSANFIDRESLRSDVYLINIKGRIDTDGSIIGSSGFRTNKIYLKDVDTIYYEGHMGGENPILCFFDKNDVIIKTLTIKSNPNILEGFATKAFDIRDPKYKDANYAIASAYLDVMGNSSAGFKNSKVIIKRITDKTNISPLKDAKVLIFGDSITVNADIQDSQDKTTYYATSPFNHSWSTYLLEYEGIKHYRNYAKSGASYGNQPGKENDRLSLTHQVKLAINDSTNPNNVFEESDFTPDIIIFALGVNDTNFKDDSYEMAMSKTVYKSDGETIDVEATLNNLDLNKMYQAARWCYLKVKQKWPFSQMFVVSPIQSLENFRQTNNEDNKYDNLKKLARRYGAVFIDGFSNGIIKEFQEIYLKDGLHPNPQGYKVMARQIIAALNANYIDYNNILNKLQN